MAHIWPVYEGREPTRGEPWATLPIKEVVGPLELLPTDFFSDYHHTPRFGRVERDLSVYGFKHIVVEVEPDEAAGSNWKAGFYKSRKQPGEVFDWLLQHALASVLGEENIVRVTYEYSTDWVGQPSMKILVVLTPGAVPKIAGKATSAAFQTTMERLSDMGVDGIPLIQYATEAELEQLVE